MCLLPPGASVLSRGEYDYPCVAPGRGEAPPQVHPPSRGHRGLHFGLPETRDPATEEHVPKGRTRASRRVPGSTGRVDAWPRFPAATACSPPSGLLRRTPVTETKHSHGQSPGAAVSCSLSAPMRHKERSPRLPGSWTPGPGATDARRRGRPALRPQAGGQAAGPT